MKNISIVLFLGVHLTLSTYGEIATVNYSTKEVRTYKKIFGIL